MSNQLIIICVTNLVILDQLSLLTNIVIDVQQEICTLHTAQNDNTMIFLNLSNNEFKSPVCTI